MKNKEYITDDCIIEDELYISIKDLIKCNICKNILKEPMQCKNCQKAYCKECFDNRLKNENKCYICGEQSEYIKSVDKAALLSNLKFLCKNCKHEIKYNEVSAHLKSGCKTNSSPTKLMDIIFKKNKVKKLSSDEVGNIKKEGNAINHLSSKKK